MKGIFWIASYPRSGNTWARAFLAALEEARSGRAPERVRLAGVWETGLLPGPPNAQTLKARLNAQAEAAARHPGPIFMKTHFGRFIVEGVPTINQRFTLGAVHLVRDPRDVALSLASQLGTDLSGAVDAMANTFFVARTGSDDGDGFELYGSWSANVASWAAAPNTLTIRYEDLHAAPVRWFRALAEHLGIAATLQQTVAAVEATTLERMRADRSALDREHIPLGPGIVGRWQTALPAELRQRIEADHQEQMRAFGYL